MCRCMRPAEKSDFIEGIRAVLVDKDHAPRWAHAGVEAVPAASIAEFFEPFSDPGEEWTPPQL